MQKKPRLSPVQLVLVITDDAVSAELWISLFREKGYAPIWSTSDYAVVAAGILLPWLVLVDSGIPHSKKLPLCQRLKSVCGAAVLVLTSSDRREIAESYAAGADECILEPTNRATVFVRAMVWIIRLQPLDTNAFALPSVA